MATTPSPARNSACSAVCESLLTSRLVRHTGGADALVRPANSLKTRAPKRPSAVSPARAAAFDILLRVERDFSYASELLHARSYEHLSTADHALATELVFGVLRWQSLLDSQIAQNSTQPLAKLDLEVVIALRLGLYQLRWLSRVPVHAAIHQSVELVKRAGKSSAASFVNAVLRKVQKVAPLQIEAAALASGTFIDKIAGSLAHPQWLVERWAQAYGPQAAEKICRYDQSIPITAIRLRRPGSELELQTEGVDRKAGRLLSSARLVDRGDVSKSRGSSSAYAVQDEASQLVAALAASGSRILDCCAAPGGKTLAIADRDPQARVIAVDLHPHRARLLRRLLLAAGKPWLKIFVLAADARQLPFNTNFDRVLADVPCSGTGTLARNPEIKWRLKPQDLADLQRRQVAILHSAIAQVAPDGRLIYSTCSLEKEENEDVVERVLAQVKTVRILDCRAALDQLKASGELVWSDPASLTRGPYLRTLPGVHPCDGFFAAILERL